MRTSRNLAGTRARVGVLCAALFAGTALGSRQGSPLTDYREGEDLYERGDLAGALRAFEAAYASDPRAHRGERIGMHFEDYDPAFQIGRIHARLGNFEQANRYFAECGASGYTAASQNAAEFARWRAVVDRALALARSRGAAAPAVTTPSRSEPAPASAPASIASPPALEERPASPTSPPPIETTIPRAAGSGSVAARAPRLVPSRAATPPPAAAIEAPVSVPPPDLAPPGSGSAALPLRAASANRGSASPRPGVSRGLAIAAVAVLFVLAVGLAFSVWRSAGRVDREGTLRFGPYEIRALVGSSPSAFVYEARDRRSGALVALKLARPEAEPELLERFRSEAEALESLLGRSPNPPAPRLLERGGRRAGGRGIEYVAMEKLPGRTLFDFSRNTRRRLDAALCGEILTAIADRLDQARAAGLAHRGLTAEDVFLIEPLPVAAGRGVELKLLGLTSGEPGAHEVRALLAVALELFESRGRSCDGEISIPERIPGPLSELLRRARDGAGPTMNELRAAFEACRCGLPEPAEA